MHKSSSVGGATENKEVNMNLYGKTEVIELKYSNLFVSQHSYKAKQNTLPVTVLNNDEELIFLSLMPVYLCHP